MAKVRLFSYDVTDPELSSRWKRLASEKGTLVFGKASITSKGIMFPVEFKPFDTDFESEAIHAEALNRSAGSIAIKSIYGNSFVFSEEVSNA